MSVLSDAWGNIVDNFKNIGNTGDPNSSKFINTQIALKKTGYKPYFDLGNVSAPKGQPSTVFAGNKYMQTTTDTTPNFMNLLLLGIGAFLIIKILD